MAGERGHGAAGEAGGVAGTGIPECGGQLARRVRRNVHGEPSGSAAEFSALPGDHQYDRDPTPWCVSVDREICRWARRQAGPTLRRCGATPDGTDQTTSPHQGFLRNLPEGGEDPGLGGDLRLRVGGHREKATGTRPQSLQNSPNSERADASCGCARVRFDDPLTAGSCRARVRIALRKRA